MSNIVWIAFYCLKDAMKIKVRILQKSKIQRFLQRIQKMDLIQIHREKTVQTKSINICFSSGTEKVQELP